MIISPDESVKWTTSSKDYKAVSININRNLIASKYRAMTGSELNQEFRFYPHIDGRSGCGRDLRNIIQLLFDSIANSDSIFENYSAAAQIEELLAVCLLNGVRHSNSEFLYEDTKSANEKTVGRVREYIRANYGERIVLETLAKVSGVSVRSLHRSFRETVGVTPSQFLKDIRLDQARARLLQTCGSLSVTKIAYSAGFTHLGNFAADYRKRFGELPSKTALRSRSSLSPRGHTKR